MRTVYHGHLGGWIDRGSLHPLAAERVLGRTVRTAATNSHFTFGRSLPTKQVNLRVVRNDISGVALATALAFLGVGGRFSR